MLNGGMLNGEMLNGGMLNGEMLNWEICWIALKIRPTRIIEEPRFLTCKTAVTAMRIVLDGRAGQVTTLPRHVTMFSGQKLLLIALWLYSLWLLHLDTEALTFFEFFFVTKALTCCCVVIVAQLNNWRVPSSANMNRLCACTAFWDICRSHASTYIILPSSVFNLLNIQLVIWYQMLTYNWHGGNVEVVWLKFRWSFFFTFT